MVFCGPPPKTVGVPGINGADAASCPTVIVTEPKVDSAPSGLLPLKERARQQQLTIKSLEEELMVRGA